MTGCCTWCGASGRELVPVADGHACTACWDRHDLAALRRLLATRDELRRALAASGLDPDTGTVTDPARIPVGIRRLKQVAARAAHVLAEAERQGQDW